MIAPYFVPRRRVGSLRPFKFTIHLQKFGYKPVVLTLGNPGDRLTKRESDLLKGIDIIEIDPPFDRTSPAPVSNGDGHKDPTESFSEKLLLWIDKHTPLDTWIYLFRTRYSQIYWRARKVRPDLIWATGDPWSGLWLGEKLAADLSKPFVADFRDPWTLANVNVRKRSYFSSGIDSEFEKKVIHSADKITFTSKKTEKNYSGHYRLHPNKTHTVYNSFDCTIKEHHADPSWKKNKNPDLLNLMFFGRFRWLSPVTPVAEALHILKKESPFVASQILIHSFGEPDPENYSVINKLGLNKNFVFHDPVVPEKMLSVLKSADMLLLSTNEERKEIIPAKLWDYLSVEVPIFSIAPNGEIEEILMRSKSGIQVYPDYKNEIEELLGSFVTAKKNDDSIFSMDADMPDRNIYEASHTTKQLATIFDEIINNA